MDEQPRPTNEERRARAREERKVREAQERKAAKRQRLVAALTTVVVLAAFGSLVVAALGGGGTALDEPIVLTAAEVDDARAEAACEVVAQTASGPATHLDAGADPSVVLSGGVQPPTGAPHTAALHPLVTRGASSQLNALALGHNLEHGAVVVWYDPDQVDGGTVTEMERWSELLNDSGFAAGRAGAAVFVAPFEEPGISSGKAVAFRSWNLGVDCSAWDETVANSFVVEGYGARDGAPEGGPFPEDTLRYAEGDAPTPLLGDGAGTPSPGVTPTPEDPTTAGADAATD
jgi:hypothetical protein